MKITQYVKYVGHVNDRTDQERTVNITTANMNSAGWKLTGVQFQPDGYVALIFEKEG